MNRTLDLIAVAQAAIKFSQAAADVMHRQEQLTAAYGAWHTASGVTELIGRDDVNWRLMMASTADEYRLLRNAKSREGRTKKKLLALTRALERL